MTQNLSDFTAWLKKLFTTLETALTKKVDSAIPPYAIMWFKRTTAPSGWAICDGRSVTMNDGTPDTTPNLIDRYPCGTKTANTIGTTVDDALPDITGEVSSIVAHGTTYKGAFKSTNSDNYDNSGRDAAHRGDTAPRKKLVFKASDSNTIYGAASIVRPKTTYLLPCMKL